eukprot:3631261-Prymnesium_polylepis.1
MCLGSHRVTIRREKRAQKAAGRAGVRVRRRIGIQSALVSLGLSRLRVLWPGRRRQGERGATPLTPGVLEGHQEP